ncbi:MAG TPA: DUF4394 domain-containing protein [Tepidisphaeraceae bacterium]|nr:DUF4394 domain-containing protein [Tepidisphaeraceae bacterium]
MRGRFWFSGCAALAAMGITLSTASAQIAYGVNAEGNLFSFDLASPSNVTTVGPVGFVPEGIDFRPGTSTLYALDVGPNTTQLYTVDIATGASTPVGAGFASSGPGYNLTGNSSYGFDFNPTTLQADNSMRIRLVATNNTNLRLNSATGQIALVDGNLAFGNGSAPFISGAAYINNQPAMGGTTALYDMDSRNNELLLQNPPNDGVVSTVGPFGFGISNVQAGIGFDIYTTPGDADPTIGGDAGWAVFKRPDAPIGGPLGAYLLYTVNLGTGATTNGALVGPAASPFDFDGGFAILPIIPEPSTAGLLAITAAVMLRKRR